jgi:hypothetical protein
MLTRLAYLVCLITVASAGSYYANDDPESCDIIGDVSMYGLGIRLGYYLQWAAAILSVYLAPDLVKTIYVSFATISIASLVCVFENLRNGYFVALEFHIILLLTAFLSNSAFRWSPVAREVDGFNMDSRWTILTGPRSGKVKQSFWGAWSFLKLSSGVAFVCVPYMYWHGNYVGHKDGCKVHIVVTIIAYTWTPDVFDPKWIIAVKVLGVIAALLGVVEIVTSLMLLFNATLVRIIGVERGYSDTWDKLAYTFVQLATGGAIIGITEATVKMNRVDLSSGTLDSSGQLIPLLIGGLTLMLVILTYLRGLAQQMAAVPYMAKYTDAISSFSDTFEKRVLRTLTKYHRTSSYEEAEEGGADAEGGHYGSRIDEGSVELPTIVVHDVATGNSTLEELARKAPRAEGVTKYTATEDDAGELSALIQEALQRGSSLLSEFREMTDQDSIDHRNI